MQVRNPHRSRLASFVLLAGMISLGGLSADSFAGELLPPEKTIEEVVDHYIQARLTTDKVVPAPQSTDANLIRRLTLDLAGRIPTVTEAQAYAAATEPDKRARAVERLLASPDFAYQQRNELDTMLMSKTNDGAWREYLLKACQENRPWDQLFREMMLTSDADEGKKAALMFLKSRARDLDELTNDTCKIFFGVSINCAKCHDHPLVLDWHQDHYFGFYSFFQRTYMNKRNQLSERTEGLVKFKTTEGVEKPAKFMFLTGSVIEEPPAPTLTEDEKKAIEKARKEDEDKKEGPPPPVPAFSPRTRLVELALKAEESRFFSRSIVNRVWARLMGRGLVMPLDQMHSENPASHPELLDWLTRDMVAHGYDLKRLMRGIVLSQAYSRSSTWNGPETQPHDQVFAVGLTRTLSPRQYSLALLFASRNSKSLPEDVLSPDWANRRKDLENHSQHLANQLEVPSDNFQVGVSEALFFANNQHVQNDLLNEGGDRLAGVLKTIPDRNEQLKLAFWTVYTRDPEAEEVAAISQYLDARADRLNVAWQQVIWSMLTSSELRFNH
ncbi:MAG: hypothetical protein JWN70_3568 [Planctomycetaceae bacterium]|nr:hypothetical protein [Planctomycetaceae bacterium]